MIVLIVITLWFFTGWLGWRLIISWWTSEASMTRGDRRFLRIPIIIGPVYLLIAGVLWAAEGPDPWRDRSRDNEIIYPRKDIQ